MMNSSLLIVISALIVLIGLARSQLANASENEIDSKGYGVGSASQEVRQSVSMNTLGTIRYLTTEQVICAKEPAHQPTVLKSVNNVGGGFFLMVQETNVATPIKPISPETKEIEIQYADGVTFDFFSMPHLLHDGTHIVNGPAGGVVSTVSVPLRSDDGQSVATSTARRVAEVLAQRQLVEAMFGVELESEKFLHEGSSTVTRVGPDSAVEQEVRTWRNYERLIRTRGKGIVRGMRTVALWKTGSGAGSNLHLSVFLEKSFMEELGRK